MSDEPEKIVAAALRIGDMICSVPPPGRHHTVMWKLDAVGIDPMYVTQPDDQGFLTSTGRFVDRMEGCKIAKAADQIKTKTGPADMLFSECMW